MINFIRAYLTYWFVETFHNINLYSDRFKRAMCIANSKHKEKAQDGLVSLQYSAFYKKYYKHL